MLFAAVSEARLHDVCGQDPNWSCRVALEQTDSAGFASAAEWVVGKPLSILAIVIAALIVNRLARRALKRGLRGLASTATTCLGFCAGIRRPRSPRTPE